MTKKELKAIDRRIEAAYRVHGSGVTIDLFSIPKIFADCRAAVARGEDLAAAVKAAVERYRVSP
jgi:hypothetical protein